MKVADILQSKGPAVKTVRPDVTALELSEQLRAERIGAMIVSATAPRSTASFPSAIWLTAWPRMAANCRA